ncbi:low-affinity inorganic phosphate transporter [Streptomyces himastatinicus ATCC 53653]|uniref:Low-affinity inorganic phosphate transporter n=1 Tax=Streptomyces himastatinicus ATCC 53653 TaxID=457427 RepID=D9WWJ1_9ACTN|nr:low-affinity inorganic phosphate transporter [Streptomyces himastatinicus ATCC 53653]
MRWGIAGRIAVSWLLTLPAAAAVGGVAAWVADRGDAGVALVASIAVVAAAGFYALSRRRPVNSGNVNELPAAERPEHPVRPAA